MNVNVKMSWVSIKHHWARMILRASVEIVINTVSHNVASRPPKCQLEVISTIGD